MLENNSFNKIICIFVALLIGLSVILVSLVTNNTHSTKSVGVEMEYERKIFAESKLTSLDIQISKENWNTLLKNAIKKDYYPCDVVINGETFKNVGIRAKGGSSLEDVIAMGNSNRFSLLINFSKYQKDQTYYGLDKLCLNNNIGDATSMKDAITYDMCAYLGLEAPLYNYTKVSLNDSYLGCYLMIEAVHKSFLKRNYGNDYGHLYEPAGEEASLNYIDNKLSSYTAISMFAKTKYKKADMNKLIRSIKNVNNGVKIEKSIDVENVLKYLAVQTIAVNLDGLSGQSAHNYFL